MIRYWAELTVVVAIATIVLRAAGPGKRRSFGRFGSRPGRFACAALCLGSMAAVVLGLARALPPLGRASAILSDVGGVLGGLAAVAVLGWVVVEHRRALASSDDGPN